MLAGYSVKLDMVVLRFSSEVLCASLVSRPTVRPVQAFHQFTSLSRLGPLMGFLEAEDKVKFKVELNYFVNMKGRKEPLFPVQSIRTDLAGSAQREDDVHTPELTWEGEIPS